MKLAIISGSLLKEINGIKNITEERIKTPFGLPSDNFISGEINGLEVVCFNRHGESRHIAPHQINYKANMFVLKILDVTHIIAVTAVGGITEKMLPMKWVVPNQIIDYTHGRMHTYNDANDAEVQHVDFSYPFDVQLNKHLVAAIEMASDGSAPRAHESEATYGVTQGPRLETVAEINRMQRDGCDIVGMTAMPEAIFARELDMKYSTLSLVVNWAAGKGGVKTSVDGSVNSSTPAIVSMDEIKQRIAEGNEVAEKIIHNVIPLLKSIE